MKLLAYDPNRRDIERREREGCAKGAKEKTKKEDKKRIRIYRIEPHPFGCFFCYLCVFCEPFASSAFKMFVFSPRKMMSRMIVSFPQKRESIAASKRPTPIHTTTALNTPQITVFGAQTPTPHKAPAASWSRSTKARHLVSEK
jgi:hypothetical protein